MFLPNVFVFCNLRDSKMGYFRHNDRRAQKKGRDPSRVAAIENFY